MAATTLGFEDIVRAAVKEELSKSTGGGSSTGGGLGIDAKTILQILKEVQKLAELRQAQQPAAQPAQALPSAPAAAAPAAATVDLYPRVIAGLKQIQATLGDLRVSELIALAESDPDTTRALLQAAM